MARTASRCVQSSCISRAIRRRHPLAPGGVFRQATGVRPGSFEAIPLGHALLIRPLTGQGVCEDLADGPEALNELIRPDPEFTKRPETEHAEDDASSLQRDRQVGSHPRLDDIRALLDSLRRGIFRQSIKAHQLSAPDSRRIPGKIFFED